MSNQATTIPTGKPGRPKSVRKRAENLIGVAGVSALAAADLHIVPGRIFRELALLVGDQADTVTEQPPQPPATPGESTP